ncbi:MAG: hypothetical protein J6T57_03830 [Alphaproteobacteria bacterium]|nr:hypothetical protein [Alphaproteobacteria bacterium]
MLKKLSVGFIGIVFGASAMAGDSGGFMTGFQFGGGLSATSGLNGFVGYANKDFDSFWWKRIGVRFDFASTKPIDSSINSASDKATKDNDVEIGDVIIKDLDIRAHHIAAMVDFYPFGNTWFLGGWRLSGGYYAGNLDLNANITTKDGSNNEFELNDQMYKYIDVPVNASASANWKYHGPYVGTGFDFGLFWGIKIYADVGVVFTNRVADPSMNVPTEGLHEWDGSTWVVADEERLETNKTAALNEIQKDLDKLKYFPIIKVGFMYRF